jgi:DNA-directed RNA polymerase subunit M/transcription elongation factor TFIIS
MKTKLQTFIERAKLIHGDRYDYSKVDYVNGKTKVMIICRKEDHGEFMQTPDSHIFQKAKCPICSYENRNESRMVDWQEVLKRIEEAHKEDFKYLDFSQVVYKNSQTKIKIICKKEDHGEFWQRPSDTCRGVSCPKCGRDKTNKAMTGTTEKFIEAANKVHNNIYDYSKVDYVGAYTKVEIICERHGSFFQNPADHVNKESKCPKCYNERRSSIGRSNKEEFINSGMIKYNGTVKYDLVEYVNSKTKVTLICDKGHQYEQTPNGHLNGYGCHMCCNIGVSKLEKEVYDFIKIYYNDAISNTNEILSPKELDIYIPYIKLAIEFNGLYWHSSEYKDKNDHKLKTDMCEKLGIHLVQIFEDDWKYKQDIVKSRLLNLMGKNDNKIAARKCVIKLVDQKVGKQFLQQNHLQGYTSFTIGCGLFFNDELVSLMTFGKRRVCLGKKESQEGEFELMRFASKLNTSVMGAANKLFKYFVDNYKPKHIISYADRCWTMNNGSTVYDKLGFTLEGLTPPNYYYVVGDKRKHRFGFRKAKLVEDGYDASMTESEIMQDRGIPKIYNSGNLKYSLTFPS